MKKSEAVIQGCSVKRVFLKILQTKGVFLRILRNFQKQLFHRPPLVAASEKLKAEAVVQRCSVEKVFLEILLNSHLCQSLFSTALGILATLFRVPDTGLFQ